MDKFKTGDIINWSKVMTKDKETYLRVASKIGGKHNYYCVELIGPDKTKIANYEEAIRKLCITLNQDRVKIVERLWNEGKTNDNEWLIVYLQFIIPEKELSLYKRQ